ncbi:accessory Sec system glycosylation chaperone GtfB [Staphylococcus delphini]|uniref:accessory Sec system glycosylation chaperone GtfB n=1 Tax=Staphylococcus delphini TaxID=53344 RepID=UPI000BBB77BB|nr:accessory Sec system glycosylation chaperone GtfB [Staphylococcus delphini]PCF41244.1 accessory Sec system glycosylation chaperone GtfB [Staphylococcus delphini]
MIKLFETFDKRSEMLWRSLENPKMPQLTIVMNEDGFLPEAITTPYQFFANYQAKTTDKALFFNELSIPDYWEIEGFNDMAWIKDMGKVRGKIIYSEHFKSRIIAKVEWFDQFERMRYVDHYTQHGIKFAESLYDTKGQLILKKYITQEGKEIIYENYVTKDVVLDWNGKTYLFDSQTSFIMFYLEQLQIDLSHIIINSLSVPFTVLYNLKQPGTDLVFWQEQSQGQIPGNMSMIFNGKMPRKMNVIINDKNEYDTITKHIDSDAQRYVHQAGYVYQYHRKNGLSNHVLTLTHSDQLEHIEPIVSACSDMTFHIAALTEMSSKLMALNAYANVKLYPVANKQTIENLFATCDIYLDINAGAEVENAIERAFYQDMLILGYRDTVHAPMYLSQENIYPKEQFESLVTQLQRINKNRDALVSQLAKQHQAANEISQKDLNQLMTRVLS